MANDQDTVAYYRPLIEPASVAVVGASASGSGPASNFLRHLRAYGYAGKIYPIHPTASEIDGLAAYPSLGDTPEPIDYAYVAVAAERVPDAIRRARGRVRFAQVMSSGFAENAHGHQAQAALLAAAHEAGVRLLGPNCMGTHSPRGRLTFVAGPDKDLGSVGVLAQSGGLSIDILRRGQNRGVRFSALVTLGNSADLGPADLLEFLMADPATKVIGLYLESVAKGRQFFDVLRAACGRKPIVLLKGGRTRAGMRASVSHTGALAADDRIWTGLARQTGMAMVDTLDEFLDALLALQTLAPTGERVTRRVALFGNGGGSSVLATDAFAREGFEVAPFSAATQSALGALDLPAGSSIDNPIDTPANALRGDDGALGVRVIDAVTGDDPPDALVMHFNLPVLLDYRNVDILGQLMKGALAAHARNAGRTHFVLVLRTDGDAGIDGQRRACRALALAAGVLCVDELIDAVKSLAAVRSHEAFRVRQMRYEVA
ncbi:MAG: CoA-binding protein [Casimicrobiaceae bacterium]